MIIMIYMNYILVLKFIVVKYVCVCAYICIVLLNLFETEIYYEHEMHIHLYKRLLVLYYSKFN